MYTYTQVHIYRKEERNLVEQKHTRHHRLTCKKRREKKLNGN